MMDKLPNGWCGTTLGEVFDFLGGGTPSKDERSFWGGKIPWASVKDIKAKLLGETIDHITESGLKGSASHLAKKGEVIVITRISPGLSTIATQNIAINQDLKIVRSFAGISPLFIHYLFNSLHQEIIGKSSGTTVLGIRLHDLKSIAFTLPPINEQIRIVAKIEYLFSELDDGIASLKTARAQLKIYRQALLKHAFEGKLTECWRKHHADQLESADQILARIAKEREAHYQHQLKEWICATKMWEGAGKKGKSPSKPSKLKVGSSKPSRHDDIPSGWSTLDLDNLAAESVLGKMLDQTKNIGTPRYYLGNINVRWGVFDLSNLKSMRIDDSEIQRYQLKENDLVVCEGGEPGRSAIWKSPEQVVFIQKALHRVRFTNSFESNFAYHYLAYASNTNRLASYFTGTTIKHLTGAGLGKITFPLCSIAEQREIISILDEKLSAIDRAEEEIKLNLQKAEALRQAILKKAFLGQLVALDPADEPAGVLLERIRAERERAAGMPKNKTAYKKALV